MSKTSSAKIPQIGLGYQTGHLTVEEKTEDRKGGYCIWRCRCTCGNSILLDTRCLQRGTVGDCGCISRVKPGRRDLTGMRFGQLVCLNPTEKKDKSGSYLWECQCDCGNVCLAAAHQLTTGYKKSCGCLSHPPVKPYVGMKFGKLTVTEHVGKVNGQHVWKCRCSCGNEVIAGQTKLQNGQTYCCHQCRVGRKASSREKGRTRVDGTNVGILQARLTNPPIQSNTSGYNGVYRNSNGFWSAQITFKGKTYYLGSFINIEDAVAMREKGNQIFEDFINWYYAQQNA